MITVSGADSNKKNVSFGTTLGFSAKRAIRKLYKDQKIPQSVKTQIQELRKDGINAKIVAKEEAFVASKRAFLINKDGMFKVKLFNFTLNIPKENKKIWLLITNNPNTFETLFTRFKVYIS